MANKDYNFQYTPLTGRLPGKSFVKQTEQAINELAGIVNEGAAQVEVITNLANTANANSEEALEKATEALETAGRVYITLPNLDDADDYYDSQLYYFANSYSANLPVQDTGFLEVKTNDTKTACEQVFIADLTGLCYFRHGTITSAEVGDETVYSVTWSTWSSELASEDYVQGELVNYLPSSGGTITGDLSVSGTISGNVDGTAATPSAGDDSTKIATTAYVQEELRLHASIPIGHEYFSMNPNVPQGSLPLIGGEYSRSTYADLWAWVQTQTGYLKTEAQWQALSTSNNGNVPFYSDGDGSTTFRVPSLHCWIKGSDGSAQLVGSYLEAGLPNLTGRFGGNDTVNPPQGPFAFNGTNGWGTVYPAQSGTSMGVDFDASTSNSIYGNSSTVQPESIVGMWLVKAYGTIEDTGTIDEQAYIDDRFNAAKTYTDTQVNAIKSTQLAGLTFHTWSGTLSTDSKGRIQGVAPLTSIPLLYNNVNAGEEYTALFTANMTNSGASLWTTWNPYIYNSDHWIITVKNDQDSSSLANANVGITLTWATAIK